MPIHSKFVPALILIAGVVILGFTAFFAFGGLKTTTQVTTVPTVVSNQNTNVSENANQNSTVNTNTANTNTTITNTAPAPTTHTVPEGPFSVNTTPLFSLAYRQSGDRLITRLIKINAKSGETVGEANIHASDIPLADTIETFAQAPSQIDFGTDGDSIVFVSAYDSQYTGIYRTTFSNPKKIETILQYDRGNLYLNDIPTIQNLQYSAEFNTVAFILPAAERSKLALTAVNLADKKTSTLATYSDAPEIVGVVSAGKAVQIFRTVRSTEQFKNKAFLENITIADGKVAKSILVYDEAALEPKMHVYGSSANLSPNARVFAFAGYAGGNSREYFWNIETKKLTSVDPDTYTGNERWAPDSGKILLYGNGKGVIYDLDKRAIATLNDAQQSILWEPGPLALYSGNDGKLYSYDLETKKQKNLPLTLTEGYYYGGGRLGISWVNR